MPQITPITLGTETFGSPRTVRNGNAVLFVGVDTINGAIGDKKLYVGEEAFSSTRARRKAFVRIEMPVIAVDSSTGVAKQIDSAEVEITLTHGKSLSEAQLVALRDIAASSLIDASYTDEVVFKRQGQW
jgi:hypothetical protein